MIDKQFADNLEPKRAKENLKCETKYIISQRENPHLVHGVFGDAFIDQGAMETRHDVISMGLFPCLQASQSRAPVSLDGVCDCIRRIDLEGLVYISLYYLGISYSCFGNSCPSVFCGIFNKINEVNTRKSENYSLQHPGHI
jgi:hypothetical protein